MYRKNSPAHSWLTHPVWIYIPRSSNLGFGPTRISDTPYFSAPAAGYLYFILKFFRRLRRATYILLQEIFRRLRLATCITPQFFRRLRRATVLYLHLRGQSVLHLNFFSASSDPTYYCIIFIILRRLLMVNNSNTFWQTLRKLLSGLNHFPIQVNKLNDIRTWTAWIWNTNWMLHKLFVEASAILKGESRHNNFLSNQLGIPDFWECHMMQSFSPTTCFEFWSRHIFSHVKNTLQKLSTSAKNSM